MHTISGLCTPLHIHPGRDLHSPRISTVKELFVVLIHCGWIDSFACRSDDRFEFSWDFRWVLMGSFTIYHWTQDSVNRQNISRRDSAFLSFTGGTPSVDWKGRKIGERLAILFSSGETLCLAWNNCVGNCEFYRQDTLTDTLTRAGNPEFFGRNTFI